jgi:predicted methyltransferase
LTLQHACLPDFYKAYTSIEAKKFIEKDEESGKLFITEEGRKQLPEQATTQPHFSTFCGRCEGRGVSLPEPRTELSNQLNEIIRDRPSPLEKYDQWYMTADHSSFRSEFIRENGDLIDKKVLFIGDDDLLSVAVSLTRLPKEVVVLEIDERIVDFVNKLGKELNIPLTGRVYDIRLPLDETLAGQFDVFYLRSHRNYSRI